MRTEADSASARDHWVAFHARNRWRLRYWWNFALFLLGLAVVWWGVHMIYEPLAWIMAGAFLVAVALFVDDGRP